MYQHQLLWPSLVRNLGYDRRIVLHFFFLLKKKHLVFRFTWYVLLNIILRIEEKALFVECFMVVSDVNCWCRDAEERLAREGSHQAPRGKVYCPLFCICFYGYPPPLSLSLPLPFLSFTLLIINLCSVIISQEL